MTVGRATTRRSIRTKRTAGVLSKGLGGQCLDNAPVVATAHASLTLVFSVFVKRQRETLEKVLETVHKRVDKKADVVFAVNYSALLAAMTSPYVDKRPLPDARGV